MAWGVIEGAGSELRLSVGTTTLPIDTSEALEDVTVVGNQFRVANLGHHAITVYVLPSSFGSSAQNSYKLQLYNDTLGTVVDSETRVARAGEMMVFLFTFNVTDATHLYELQVVIDSGVGTNYKVSFAPKVMKCLIQAMSETAMGALTGGGTADTIPLWSGATTLNDSQITQTASMIDISARDLSIDDGQKMLFGTDTTLQRSAAAVLGLGDALNTYLQVGANTVAFATANSDGVDMTIRVADGNGSNKSGGSLILQPGAATGSGTPGSVQVPGLGQIQENINALGNCTGAQSIDLSLGNVVTATLTGDGTWTFTDPAVSGKASTVTILLTNGGAFTITWAVSPKWPGGVAPTFTAAGLDIVTMTTIDGGTTWYATVAQDVK